MFHQTLHFLYQRNFTAAQLEGLVRDMSTLNLSKYLSEAAAAIVEAKLKVRASSRQHDIRNVRHVIC